VNCGFAPNVCGAKWSELLGRSVSLARIALEASRRDVADFVLSAPRKRGQMLKGHAGRFVAVAAAVVECRADRQPLAAGNLAFYRDVSHPPVTELVAEAHGLADVWLLPVLALPLLVALGLPARTQPLAYAIAIPFAVSFRRSVSALFSTYVTTLV